MGNGNPLREALNSGSSGSSTISEIGRNVSGAVSKARGVVNRGMARAGRAIGSVLPQRGAVGTAQAATKPKGYKKGGVVRKGKGKGCGK